MHVCALSSWWRPSSCCWRSRWVLGGFESISSKLVMHSIPLLRPCSCCCGGRRRLRSRCPARVAAWDVLSIPAACAPLMYVWAQVRYPERSHPHSAALLLLRCPLSIWAACALAYLCRCGIRSASRSSAATTRAGRSRRCGWLLVPARFPLSTAFGSSFGCIVMAARSWGNRGIRQITQARLPAAPPWAAVFSASASSLRPSSNVWRHFACLPPS